MMLWCIVGVWKVKMSVCAAKWGLGPFYHSGTPRGGRSTKVLFSLVQPTKCCSQYNTCGAISQVRKTRTDTAWYIVGPSSMRWANIKPVSGQHRQSSCRLPDLCIPRHLLVICFLSLVLKFKWSVNRVRCRWLRVPSEIFAWSHSHT